MADVRIKIGERLLTEAEAARANGVTAATLSRHLDGAYVRSDSLVKYRRWISSDAEIKGSGQPGRSPEREVAPASELVALREPADPLVAKISRLRSSAQPTSAQKHSQKSTHCLAQGSDQPPEPSVCRVLSLNARVGPKQA
jgi:hypothetical protein